MFHSCAGVVPSGKGSTASPSVGSNVGSLSPAPAAPGPPLRVVRGERVRVILPPAFVHDLHVVALPRHGHALDALRLLLHAELDAEHGVLAEDSEQRVDLLVHRREALRGLHAEAQHVPARALRGVDDEAAPELALAQGGGPDLDVRHGDVEVFRRVGVPHDADVGDVERPEVAAVVGEVPHAGILLYTSSFGNSLSSLSAMMAPRSLRSRYSLLVSYARNTAWTVVNNRGESFTRLVKMNSNREPWNLVMTYSACVLPRRREEADLMLMLTMELYPTLRFVRARRLAIHRIRRFVTTSSPDSPLLPFVSSTRPMRSI